MSPFPEKQEHQVTLSNWRNYPFNKWSFQHVREIIPTAEIENDPKDIQKLSSVPTNLSDLEIKTKEGRKLCFENFLKNTDTDGLVILKSGKLIYERYFNGMSSNSTHILMSVSKSILGLISGILIDRNLFFLDQKITEILPELKKTAYEGASIRQLLDMRAGIDFDEDYLATAGLIIDYRKATGWNPPDRDEPDVDLKSFYSRLTKDIGPHNGPFNYVSPNTDLLGWAIERVTNRPYSEVVSELLWKPLGASRPGYVTVDRLGAPRVAGGVCVTTRDLALLGQLIIEKGTRNEKQIIPEYWISDISNNGNTEAWNNGNFAYLFPNASMHYRSKWYVKHGKDNQIGQLLFGVGVHGQNIFVDHEKDLVVVKLSSQKQPLDAEMIHLTSGWIELIRAEM